MVWEAKGVLSFSTHPAFNHPLLLLLLPVSHVVDVTKHELLEPPAKNEGDPLDKAT